MSRITPFTCSKCLREDSGGLAIANKNTDENLFFCSSCLKQARSELNMKKNKTGDEIELLAYIRKHLKTKKN